MSRGLAGVLVEGWRGCGLESKVTPLLVNVKLLAMPRFSAGFIIIYAEGAVLQRCATVLQSAASFIKVYLC